MTRNHKILLLMWLLLTGDTGGVARRARVHPDVGSVSMPVKPVYISTDTWDHLFQIDLPCIYDLVTDQSVMNLRLMTQNSVSTLDKMASKCKTENFTGGEADVDFLCQMIEGEKDLMNQTLAAYHTLLSKTIRIDKQLSGSMEGRNCSQLPELLGKRKKRSIRTSLTSNIVDDIHSIPDSDSNVAEVFQTPRLPLNTNPDSNKTHFHLGDNAVYLSNVHIGDNSIFDPTGKHATRNEQRSAVPQDQRHQLRTGLKYTSTDHVERIIRRISEATKSACYHNPLSPETEAFIHAQTQLVSLLLTENGMERCDVPILGETCAKTRRTRAIEETPGILPWDFSITKWLWGGLGTKDATEINNLFNSTTAALNSVNNKLLTIQEKSISAIKTVVGDVNTQLNDLNVKLRNVAQSQQIWANQVTDKITQLDNNAKLSAVTTWILTILTQSSQTRSFLEEFQITLANYVQAMQTVVAIINKQKIPIRFLPESDVAEAIKNIEQSLPDDLSLVPLDMGGNPFYHISPTCTLGIRTMTLLYKLPLITNPYTFEAWKTYHMAFAVGSNRFRLNSGFEAVLMSAITNSWYGFSNAEFALCESTAMRVCPFTPALHTSISTHCITELIKGSPVASNLCEILPVTESDLSLTTILPTGSNSWVVSLPIVPTSVTQLCKSNISGADVSEVRALTGLTEIELPLGCALNLGLTVLVPHDVSGLISSSDMKIDGLTKSVGAQVPRYTSIPNKWLKLVTPNALNITRLNITMMDSRVSTIKDPISVTELENLLSNNSWTKPIKLSDFSDLSTRSHTIPIPGLDTSIILPWSLGTFMKFQLILDAIVCICITYKVITLLGLPRWIQAAALPRGELLRMNSYASPVVQDRHNPFLKYEDLKTTTMPTTTSTTTPRVDITTNGSCQLSYQVDEKLSYIYQMLTNLTTTMPTCESHKANLPWRHIGITTAIMILLAVVCHHWLKRAISRKCKHQSLSQLEPIQNQSTLHYAGETKVLVGVIMRAYRSMKTYDEVPKDVASVCFTSVFQLCTLPKVATAYTVKAKTSLAGLIADGHASRWSNQLNLTINWGPLCIVDTGMPTTDLCTSLPTQVKLNLPDLVYLARNHLPVLWTRVVVEGIHHINLTDHRSTVRIYDANTLP